MKFLKKNKILLMLLALFCVTSAFAGAETDAAKQNIKDVVSVGGLIVQLVILGIFFGVPYKVYSKTISSGQKEQQTDQTITDQTVRGKALLFGFGTMLVVAVGFTFIGTLINKPRILLDVIPNVLTYMFQAF